MYFAAGLILLFLELISAEMKKAPLFMKCLLGTIFITAVEFIFGCVFNLKYNFAVWDYSKQPFNILGQICLPFSLIWFGICFIIFKLVIKEDFHRRFI
ncbi:MAG: putative ABC transporter permease [Clostridiales bacterium]|nr:putative ABC transporter permease [Clostridiales bacterium]